MQIMILALALGQCPDCPGGCQPGGSPARQSYSGGGIPSYRGQASYDLDWDVRLRPQYRSRGDGSPRGRLDLQFEIRPELRPRYAPQYQPQRPAPYGYRPDYAGAFAAPRPGCRPCYGPGCR